MIVSSKRGAQLDRMREKQCSAGESVRRSLNA